MNSKIKTNAQRKTLPRKGILNLPKINQAARTNPPQRFMAIAPPKPNPPKPEGPLKHSIRRAIPIPTRTPPKIFG